MGKPVKKAIFPVGGLGTRFLPATKAIPKEMLPVVDKPLIQWAVEEARAAGIEEFIFVTGRGKAVLEDHFDHSQELARALEERGKTAELEAINAIVEQPGQVIYTRQQRPLGLGHAVWCARNLIGDEPFAVLLADDLVLAETPCLEQMVEAYGGLAGNLVAVTEVGESEVGRYGILDVAGEDGRVVSARGVVEKPDAGRAPSRLAVIGRYILRPRVLAHLARGVRGAGGEIQLTDALAAMIGEVGLYGLRFEGRRFDCGTRAGFLEANIAFALERADLREEARRICRTYAQADGRPRDRAG